MSSGVRERTLARERQLELRYLGQEHAIIVSVGAEVEHAAIRAEFEEGFRARYGHVMEGTPVQILNVRVRGIGRSARPELARLPAADGDASRALLEHRPAYCFDRRARVDFAVYERRRLAPGDRIDGPAIVDEGTATTVVHSDESLCVDDYGHLLIEVGALA